MDLSQAENYSLADFLFGDPDSTNPLIPPSDYIEWRRTGSWGMSLYEPALHGAAVPRTQLECDGVVRPIINLSSYNYMGMAKHPEVIAAAKEALDTHGFGACGSPVLSGMSNLHRQFEKKLAEHLQVEQATLFNSGFGGALGSMQGLLRKGDIAVIDAKAHASLIDGVRLSGATLRMFPHNDMKALEETLAKGKGQRQMVIVEGIYSMDGDMADLKAIVPMAEAMGVPVFLDEAHSFLGCGENGRGASEHLGVEGRIGLLYGTFSKALAAVGGFVAGKSQTIDYMRFYANSYTFSAALPPAIVAGAMAGLGIVKRDPSIRKRLWENANYFRSRVRGLGIDTGESCSYVVPLVIGPDRRGLYELCRDMRNKGLFLAPVDYPSVPEEQVRFRASVTAAHTKADLDDALNIIEDTIVRRLRQRGALKNFGS
ncbi:MAG: aminotransferase class I/II-fold pyridoxal phosphate-dependent enzyme [Myxococcales bacterium]|nr:aminotransferase class I/II-fold pyridoxal phosphate-dependent enzyme [Myxococcales bacterium]